MNITKERVLEALKNVENMSYSCPPDEPEKRYYIFGKDGAKKLAEESEVPLLSEMPLVQSIRESSDLGNPAVLQVNTPQAVAFMEMARKVAQRVSTQNAKEPFANVADVKW